MTQNKKTIPKSDLLTSLVEKETPFTKKVLAIRNEALREAVAKVIQNRAKINSVEFMQSVFIKEFIPKEHQPAVAYLLANFSPINTSALRQKLESGFKVPTAGAEGEFIDHLLEESPL